MKMFRNFLPLFVCMAFLGAGNLAGQATNNSSSYDDLVKLFNDWRAFESSLVVDGVPDYSKEQMAKMHQELKTHQNRLNAFNTSGWSIPQQVDWHIIRAEMNGMDFNIRVLKPWVRDPAFYQTIWTYQSDTPAHEGPYNHTIIDLWQYNFPLSKSAEKDLTKRLLTIAPLLESARTNLTGNARELWIGGIINIRGQASALEDLQKETAKSGRKLKNAVKSAHEATLTFIEWLEAESDKKTGPSGIGKENYTWHRKNVHYTPMSWEDEVRLLKRELARAHASLRLEEQRNKHLPPLKAASTPEEYDLWAEAAVTRFMKFMERKNILHIKDYMDATLRDHKGRFVPEEKRNFFRTAMHYDTNTLNAHFYHWWDLQRMEKMPHSSPMRRGPLLYNIWDSRSEGHATGFEEMVMHAGLYDSDPQIREIVWIMLAQRAARGLGSLYAHANEYTMKEARDFHVKWTPRGWMREDLDLLGFEQLLYLRQPGYGSIYITGKYLIEQLMAERSTQLGDKFNMADFFEEMDATGLIPVSLIRWEMTGLDNEIKELMRE